jgi:hypothetical protein
LLAIAKKKTAGQEKRETAVFPSFIGELFHECTRLLISANNIRKKAQKCKKNFHQAGIYRVFAFG